MKKLFSFTERSANVVCANPNCSKIRGAEGVARMPIKKNVISRSPDGKPLVCYDCAEYAKTGKTRKQRKGAEQQRKLMRQMVQREQVVETMVANV